MTHCKICGEEYTDWLRHINSAGHKAAREKQPIPVQSELGADSQVKVDVGLLRPSGEGLRNDEETDKPKPDRPCHNCGSYTWWWRHVPPGIGEWLCGICHPAPKITQDEKGE